MEKQTTNSHRRPLIVATSVLVVGVLASLAGNIQAINLGNANPGIGAHVSAVFWPIMLFAMVELLLHTPWLNTWRDTFTQILAVVAVAAVAAWVSYWHLASVLSHYGYDVASRYAGPLAVDTGLILAALALHRIGLARRASVQDNQASDATVLDMADGQVIAVLSDQAALDAATDMAHVQAGQELAEEAESFLANLGLGLDSTTTPAIPVVSGELPQRVRTSRMDEGEALVMIQQGMQEGRSFSDIDQIVAAWFQVNPRTVRRLRAAHGLK